LLFKDDPPGRKIQKVQGESDSRVFQNHKNQLTLMQKIVIYKTFLHNILKEIPKVQGEINYKYCIIIIKKFTNILAGDALLGFSIANSPKLNNKK
jgi:hypothetical protein